MPFDFNNVDHKHFMREALKEASLSLRAGERPIGAVIVYNGDIIGRGHAQHLIRNSEIAHAELIAILQAEKYLYENVHGDCLIYSTVEPCVMCLGAIVMANIDNVVYGLPDNWIMPGEMLNIDYVRAHIKNYVGGILADDSSALWKKSSWDELFLLREGRHLKQI